MTGAIYSLASVQAYGATVDGDVITGGVFSAYNGTQRTGGLWEHTAPGLPTFPTVPAATSGGADVTVSTGVLELDPGNYGRVAINSGTPPPVLQLRDGQYTFRTFITNDQSELRLAGDNVLVVVKEQLHYRGQLTRTGSTGAPALDIRFLGINQAFLEASFRGSVVAPAGAVTLGGGNGQVTYQGQVAARNLLLRPGVQVMCDAALASPLFVSEQSP